MPAPTAHVVNLTGKMHRLQAMVNGKMESIHVPPTQGGSKPSRVPAHFVTWQKPHVNHIRVMHFTDKHGRKCSILPADQVPAAFNHPKKPDAPTPTPAPATNNSPAAPVLGAAQPTPAAMAAVPLRAAAPINNAGTTGVTGGADATGDKQG